MSGAHRVSKAVAEHCAAVTDCEVARTVLTKPLLGLDAEQLQCVPLIAAQLFAAPRRLELQPRRRWLLPEPWNGHLTSARLLFIGQNPSADHNEEYPTGSATWRPPAADLVKFFDGRFADRPNAPIAKGTKVLLRTGEHGRPNQFLGLVRQLAGQITGKGESVEPGVDYAITEAVRCKAANATGIERAVTTCAEKHLRQTLSLSGARVIVCLGRIAAQAMEIAAGIEPLDRGQIVHWGSRKVVFVHHSGARVSKDVRKLSGATLKTLRRELSS